MTQQLGKSSKSLRFCVPSTFYSTDCSRPARSSSVRKDRSRGKNRGIAATSYEQFGPIAGKILGFSKRQETLQKEEESRKKAEGKRQEAQMQIFSLGLSPSPNPRLNPSLSASSYLLRTDRGFLLREELGAASQKQTNQR
ncbi:hypothetical protein QUB63_19890 [Microcoleus sp. ARI1-B5]|uniref:hypothetical protein n=1 Tax=unclassified Microcoleus TaxID=2642155 RepID=UPI002FD4D987